MQFLPGQSGNPSGRRRGAKGGRSRALVTLDKMLAKHANQMVLSRAMEVEFRKDAVRFFRTIVMPLLPRESRLAMEQTGVVGWRSLVSASVTGAGLANQVEGGGLKVAGGAQRSEIGCPKSELTSGRSALGDSALPVRAGGLPPGV